MIKKNILIVCSSSVAIIKAKKVIDELKTKHSVEVILTEAAKKGYPESSEWETIKPEYDLVNYPNHIKWSKWADLTLVIPATTNTIAKFNAVIGDNFASSTLLGTRKPIIFVPAMNTFMYKKLVDQNIIHNLSKQGHMFIGPVNGKLKEGETGMGRMVEPKDIIKNVLNYLIPNNKKVLIPYGASQVPIDPVRYITNHSSGFMGKQLSNEMRLQGFDVKTIDISNYSNQEFLNIAKELEFDTYISPAAFSDYKIKYTDRKIRKGEINSLTLENEIDIISELKNIKPNVKYIGFKLSSNEEDALLKLKKLNLYGIIWNKVSAMNNNKTTGKIIFQDKEIAFNNLSKNELSKIIAMELKNRK